MSSRQFWDRFGGIRHQPALRKRSRGTNQERVVPLTSDITSITLFGNASGDRTICAWHDEIRKGLQQSASLLDVLYFLLGAQ
jgi:hypothetical protein